tara:strand:+ start:170 stop:313 length:144 start_codon:yes stop_codon:yes gene_type:complete
MLKETQNFLLHQLRHHQLLEDLMLLLLLLRQLHRHHLVQIDNVREKY